MLPVYRYMDSYPQPQHHSYQKCHIPCYYPNWEAIPPTKPDTAVPPATYGPWSYGGSFGHPNPMECHGCCNHFCPPGYYAVRPPHSHFPPPSPVYYHGPYPSYAEAYPPYHVPPHYLMEQPRHCCGCADHVCKQKEDKGVKIEECEPEIEKKTGSLSPESFASNQSYPFALVPPRSNSSEIDPKIWDGWYPFGMKNDNESGKHSKSLEKVEDDKRNQNQNKEDKRAQFPFPLFWIPACEKLEESRNKDLKESDTTPKVMEEQPAKLKAVPANHPGDGVLEKKAENDVKAKNNLFGVLEETGSKKLAETGRILREIPVKQIEENGKKSSGNNLEKKSSSPRKASKLPPVCLRVDPLPRRKSGNGTSRSPSPPGVKKANQKSGVPESTLTPPAVERRVYSAPSEQVPLHNKAGELEPSKEMKVVETEEKVDHMKEEVPDEVTKKPTTVEGDLFERENTSEAKGAAEVVEEKTEKKELSTTEAAVLIQSFYRGFELRRWEPLKKLKQIAKVREQADEVKNRIQTLQSSTELQKDEKQRVLIGETIMSLLLQLDTIQGLHPSVRDIRKSVARELVCLQERVDSLVSRKAREEENPEVTNPSETSVQEGDVSSGCMPPEPIEKPKEELSADVRKESTTEIDSNNDDSALPFSVANHEKQTFEAMENGQKMNECGLKEPAEPGIVVDKNADSEMEELKELCRDDRSCEPQEGHETAVAAGIDADDGYEPDATHLLEELPQGILHEMPDANKDVNKELVLQEVVDSSCSQEDSLSLRTVDEKPLFESDAKELGLESEDADHMKDVQASERVDEEHVEVPQEGQLLVCSSAEESKLGEEPTGVYENNVGYDEPATLTGVVLMSQEDMEMPDFNRDENKEIVSQVVDSSCSHKDSLSLRTADEKPPFQSDNKELGMVKDAPILESEDADHMKDAQASERVDEEHVEIPQQGQLLVCSSAEESELGEEPTGVYENNVDNGEPATLTGIVLIPQEHMETTTKDNESNSLEETEKSVASTRIGNPCLDSSLEECGILEASTYEDVEQEMLVNEELPLNNSDMGRAEDKKLMEENEKLRELVGKLLQEGNQQLTVISDLNGRVKELERKLSKKNKKVRMRRPRAGCASSYIKPKSGGCVV